MEENKFNSLGWPYIWDGVDEIYGEEKTSRTLEATLYFHLLEQNFTLKKSSRGILLEPYTSIIIRQPVAKQHACNN
ncbi:MAG: hypothetical protein ACI91R_002132 [Vicingaceae bacterium]